MKRLLLQLVVLLLPLSAIAEGLGGRAEWRFSKKKSAASESYLASGVYPSSVGVKGACLSFYHKGKLAKPELNEKGCPTAQSVKGDYWLLEMPTSKRLESGTVVDLFLPVVGNKDERNTFVLEYRDGKRWKPASTLLTTVEPKHPYRLWQSVRFERSFEAGEFVQLRLKQCDKKSVQSTIACPSPHGQQPQMAIYNNAMPRDTLRMLFLGNSYTYYHTYPVIFKELAWSEGHYADCNIFISGGYTMKAHLNNPHSMEQVDKGGYDYVMLQDQSILPTLNGTADDAGSAKYVARVVKRAFASSPKAKVMLEITWGRRYGSNNFGKYEKYIAKYPHFYADYDAMQNRLIEVVTDEADACGAGITPVGYAWQIVMHERGDINLYHTDNHHQSYAGAYLSAAVAYLTVYGQPFGDNPSNGKLDSQTAAYLRSVAERVVLKGEKWQEK